MSLAEYNKKRHFDTTPEPKGKKGTPGRQLRFVVHKHAATQLHYDLRLEMDGVMKSWALPKGPSLDPSVKHLAMMVEDHPIEYNQFEGVIPEGNYGAGTVMVWDEGTATDYDHSPPEEAKKNLLAGLHKGDFKFDLQGKKLKGKFVLVKTSYGKNTWLLIKKHDQHASTQDVTKQDQSAKSGKTMEQITAASLRSSSRRSGNLSNKDRHGAKAPRDDKKGPSK